MPHKSRHVFTGLAIALLLMTAMIDPVYSMSAAAALLIAYVVITHRSSRAKGLARGAFNGGHAARS